MLSIRVLAMRSTGDIVGEYGWSAMLSGLHDVVFVTDGSIAAAQKLDNLGHDPGRGSNTVVQRRHLRSSRHAIREHDS
jgi:hypothetical protein